MTTTTRRPGLVVGVGTRRGAPAEDLHALVHGLCAGEPVGQVVTSGRKADEPAVVELAARLGAALVSYDDETLRRQPVTQGSTVVARHVGVRSVAEAAVLAAGATVMHRARSATAVVVVGRVQEAT